MFGNYFYNQTFKRAVSIFGTLFNNITIKDIKSDGTTLGQQKVPISYGPKQKFLARIEQDLKERDGNISAISLPRMSFEISGISYDASRQQNKMIRTVKATANVDDKTKRSYQYAPAPYNLDFSLSIMAKNANDALQIVEQILPYFQPEYTVTMKMVDDMQDIRDVPISLNSVTMSDTYEGSFDERRVIEYTLEFTMKLYFFGPVNTGGMITQVIERDYISDGQNVFTTSSINGAGLVKEVKSYEPAFSAVANQVNGVAAVEFGSAIDSRISVGDEVFGTNFGGLAPTILSISEDRQQIVLSDSITIDANTTLKFVGSVQPNDTFVVSENVSFYDEGVISTFSEDTESDNE